MTGSLHQVEVHRQIVPAKQEDQRTVLTIGAYDGVHKGHRSVISEVCRLASEQDLRSAVVTFDRHPASVVRPESAPLLLTDLDQKLEQLATTGIDLTLVVPFDQSRAKETAEEFIEEVLVNCLKVKHVVVGEDFHFGHQRLGNVTLLQEAGKEHDFTVIGMDLVGLNGEPARDHKQVSSTFIRQALGEGELEKANDMLGRDYEVSGVVTAGDGRGKELGFPTANVRINSSILLPADGVYAGWLELSDKSSHPTAISLGTRPHFYEDGDLLLEAHVLDFNRDLYGEQVRVRFTERLRSQKKFDNLEALLAQLNTDVQTTKQIMASK